MEYSSAEDTDFRGGTFLSVFILVTNVNLPAVLLFTIVIFVATTLFLNLTFFFMLNGE